tara:strand:+ start:234 stop:548 length:315 start_codon:yes stop_codon:yes gene_type:complete
MAKYELEDKERELLESVFSMAQRVVDLQYDDAVAEELQSILLDSAELFDIEMNEMILNEDPETGEIRIRFVEDKLEEPAVKKAEKPRWTPKVITNDRSEDDKSN